MKRIVTGRSGSSGICDVRLVHCTTARQRCTFPPLRYTNANASKKRVHCMVVPLPTTWMAAWEVLDRSRHCEMSSWPVSQARGTALCLPTTMITVRFRSKFWIWNQNKARQYGVRRRSRRSLPPAGDGGSGTGPSPDRVDCPQARYLACGMYLASSPQVRVSLGCVVLVRCPSMRARGNQVTET